MNLSGLSVDTSVDTGPIYRPVLDRVSTNVSTDISTDVSVEAPHEIHDPIFHFSKNFRHHASKVNMNYNNIKHGVMLFWFKDLMNVTEKLQCKDSTFRHSCLVPSSGVI